MKIKLLKVEDFKRLEKVEIEPGERSLVIIGGDNCAGKSSLIDALTAAFGGTRQAPNEAIRRGGKKASIEVVLDEDALTVQRVFTSKSSRLEVRSKNGAVKSPQKMLDQLVGKRFLDPIEFQRRSPAEQRATLLRCLDLEIDLDKLAEERKEAYDRRREFGRDIKRLEAELAGIGEVGEVLEPVSVAALSDELEALRERERTHDALAAMLSTIDEDGKRLHAEVSRLEDELLDAKTRLVELRRERVEAAARLHETPSPRDEEWESVRAKIASAEETNREIAEQRARGARAAVVEKDLDDLLNAYTSADNTISKLDETKATALEVATLPIPGLDVSEDGVLYDGLPLEQASGAQQLEISLAIAMALKPELREVWVKDGSLLDDRSLEIVRRLAEEHDCRVWLERVGDGDDDAIVIEEGKVRE